jgi:hypothetical protein
MVNDTPNTPPGPHPPEWLQFQREMAERGITIQLPNVASNWSLIEPIEVEGELASEALIRLRRTARW